MKAATTADQLLTVPEVAERLGICRRSVYNLISDRSIKTVDVGRGKRATKSRVKESELARFIASREH